MDVTMDVKKPNVNASGVFKSLDKALVRFRQHQVIGLCLTLWGWSMVVFPRFAFQGDLFAFSPAMATGYAQLFVIAGVYLLTHEPHRRREAFWALSPLLAHLALNVWRIVGLALSAWWSGGRVEIYNEIPMALMFVIFIVFIALWIDRFEVADDDNSRGV